MELCFSTKPVDTYSVKRSSWCVAEQSFEKPIFYSGINFLSVTILISHFRMSLSKTQSKLIGLLFWGKVGFWIYRDMFNISVTRSERKNW